ncbi:MAG: C39 family peptidase [Thermoplasmatales archaeon]|nr:C39 family peptidase [Thermoplasmatales archaeon]
MNATVTVKDNNGVIVYTGLTDYYGYVRWIPVPCRMVTKTSDNYLHHTVTATKDGISLKVLEGWEDDLNLSVTGSSASSGKLSVLTVDRNKNTYWKGESGQSSYLLALDTGHSIAQGNMGIYYPEGCTDEYNMTVRVHSHSGIGTTGVGLSFDGNDYVSIPESDSLDLSGGNFTEEVWIYPTITDDNFHGFLGYHAGDRYRYPGLWIYQKTRIHGGFGDGTNWNSFCTGNVITQNAWNHVVATFDGTYYKVYVNGEEVYSTDSFAGRKPYPTKRVFIGKVDNYFNGVIDEVRILNRAMSPDEIKQDYTNKIYNPADGVVGWWHFDENINNTVYDASSNYNNGTILGATWADGIGNGSGVREINVVKASTDTVTNVLLSPNPDIIDKVEIIFNTWTNTPKISEVTGLGDTVSPELAKTIAKERIKLLAKEDYPEWANAIVSDPAVHYSSLGDPVVYEMAILSQEGSVLGGIRVTTERKGTPILRYDSEEPEFMRTENRTHYGSERCRVGEETYENIPISIDEIRKGAWQHLTYNLLFNNSWGSTKHRKHIDVPHITQKTNYCSPASGAMLFKYWYNQGISNYKNIDQDMVASFMRTTSEGTDKGNIASGMANAANAFGHYAYSGDLWWGANYDDWCKEIKNGYPTIKSYFWEWGSWHTMAGEGYQYYTRERTIGYGWLSYSWTETYDQKLLFDNPQLSYNNERKEEWGAHYDWFYGRYIVYFHPFGY